MTLAEALEALKAGKHIRRVPWKEGLTVFLDKNGYMDANCFGKLGDLPHGLTWEDLLTDDWRVAEPSVAPPEVVFEVALAAMRAGKSVRRRSWLDGDLRPFKQRQTYLIEDGIAYFHPGPEGLPRLRAVFDSEDVLATDWEIMP
jgi:hypothetical protein